MKKFFFVFSFLLIISPAILAQCGDCKSRNIRVYDLYINLPTLEKYDSLLILNYFKALKVTPAIADYLRGSSCLVVRGGEVAGGLTLEQAMASWQTVQNMATSQAHSAGGSASEDYYITGEVMPEDQSLQYSLEVYAKNGEMVIRASDNIPYFSYSPEMVTAAVAKTMQNQIGDLYGKLHDFEVLRRDSGEPYAIFYPEMELTPEKTVIGVNETTKIKIVFKDCDEQPLANRKIDVTGTLGTVDPTSVTTDGNGEASVDFTSNTNTGMATIKFTTEYLEPWETVDQKKDYSPSTSITIEKPQDAWFMFARRRFDESRYHKTKLENLSTSSGDYFLHEDVQLFAWVKIEKHIVGWLTLDTFFVTPTKDPIAVNWSGRNSEHGGSNSYASFEVGYIKEDGYFNINATHAGYAQPQIYISLDDAEEADDTYSVTITGLKGYRDGKYHNTTETYIIYEGTKTESSTTDADTSAAFNWGVHDAMFDTSYSNHSSDDMTEKTTTVSQDVEWRDQKFFSVVQEKHMVSETTVEAPGVEDYEKWMQDFLSEVYLYYDMKTVDVKDPYAQLPETYSLGQNYPNPFNPFTNFSYSLPERSWVTIKIYDILGNEVVKITDEEKEAGKYDVVWNAMNYPSGVYLYELHAGNFAETKKMILMK